MALGQGTRNTKHLKMLKARNSRFGLNEKKNKLFGLFTGEKPIDHQDNGDINAVDWNYSPPPSDSEESSEEENSEEENSKEENSKEENSDMSSDNEEDMAKNPPKAQWGNIEEGIPFLLAPLLGIRFAIGVIHANAQVERHHRAMDTYVYKIRNSKGHFPEENDLTETANAGAIRKSRFR